MMDSARLHPHITRAKRKANFSFSLSPSHSLALLLRSDMESFPHYFLPHIVFRRCRSLVYYKIVKRSNNYRAIHKSLRMPKRFQVSDYKVHKVSTRNVYDTTPDILRYTHASAAQRSGREDRPRRRLIGKWVKFIDWSSLRRPNETCC